MKIKVISVDHDKSKQFSDMITDYSKRMPYKLEMIDLQPIMRPTAQQQQDKEGDMILKYLAIDDFMVAMDVSGKQMSSEEFAAVFADWQQRSIGKISFVIGGAFGLSQMIKTRANLTMSLSKMTFPHRLAKIILVEQIYRAYAIMHNHPYHK